MQVPTKYQGLEQPFEGHKMFSENSAGGKKNFGLKLGFKNSGLMGRVRSTNPEVNKKTLCQKDFFSGDIKS